MQSLSSLIAALLICCATQALAKPPERIISLAPVISEWVSDLLGEKEALQHLVGVSEYSNYPVSLKQIQTIGPYPQINIEKIASLRPELVIASEEYNRPDQLEKLKRLKLRVEILPREHFNEMGAWILKLASVLDEVKKGASLSRRWMDEVSALERATVQRRKIQRAFIQIQLDPLITIGQESFLTDAFDRVGYINVFGNLGQAYPKVSKEAVLKEDPEVIFILDLTGFPDDFKKAKNEWAKYPGLRASKNDKIKLISGDDFARCSFRLLKGLRSLE